MSEVTKETLRAAREADHVSLVWNPEKYESGGVIRFTREIRTDAENADRDVIRMAKRDYWRHADTSAWTIQYDHVLPVSVRVTTYHGTSRSAHYSVMFPQSSDEQWRAVVAMLRVGDEVSLRFVAANDSDNDRNVGWHRDECYLVVERGANKWSFLIGVQVGPDNTARMVQS